MRVLDYSVVSVSETCLLPAETVRTVYPLASNSLAMPIPMSPIDRMPTDGLRAVDEDAMVDGSWRGLRRIS